MYITGGKFGNYMRGNVFNDGERQLKEFEAEPGVEYTVHTEWDWTNPEISKDFSVVAYGMGGEEL